MTTINFAAYIPLALRTEAPLPTLLDRLNHSLLGLISENGEATTEIKRIAIYGKSLDDLAKDGKRTLRQNIAEEIGDKLWYIAIAADVLGFVPEVSGMVPYNQITIDGSSALITSSFAAAGAAGEIAGVLLRANRNAHDKSGPQRRLNDFVSDEGVSKLKAKLDDILTTLSILSHVINIPLQQIADENIAKLALRYPDKFSAEAAEARADKGGLDARNS